MKNLKKMLFLSLFLGVSSLQCNANEAVVINQIGRLRQYEVAAISGLSKFFKFGSEISAKAGRSLQTFCLTRFRNMEDYATFLANEATENQVKTYAGIAAVTALLSAYGVYKLVNYFIKRDRNIKPAYASNSYTGNR